MPAHALPKRLRARGLHVRCVRGGLRARARVCVCVCVCVLVSVCLCASVVRCARLRACVRVRRWRGRWCLGVRGEWGSPSGGLQACACTMCAYLTTRHTTRWAGRMRRSAPHRTPVWRYHGHPSQVAYEEVVRELSAIFVSHLRFVCGKDGCVDAAEQVRALTDGSGADSRACTRACACAGGRVQCTA